MSFQLVLACQIMQKQNYERRFSIISRLTPVRNKRKRKSLFPTKFGKIFISRRGDKQPKVVVGIPISMTSIQRLLSLVQSFALNYVMPTADWSGSTDALKHLMFKGPFTTKRMTKFYYGKRTTDFFPSAKNNIVAIHPALAFHFNVNLKNAVLEKEKAVDCLSAYKIFRYFKISFYFILQF